MPLCAVVCCSLLIGLTIMLCAFFKKKKYTFGYLNKGDSWSCVGAGGGGLLQEEEGC